MTYRAFDLPEYHEFLDGLGVAPEMVDEAGVQRLTFEIREEVLVLTLDPPGRSVHCRWTRGSEVLAELFREGAVRIHFSSLNAGMSVAIDFETDSQYGRLDVDVKPTFAIRDRLLFR